MKSGAPAHVHMVAVHLLKNSSDTLEGNIYFRESDHEKAAKNAVLLCAMVDQCWNDWTELDPCLQLGILFPGKSLKKPQGEKTNEQN